MVIHYSLIGLFSFIWACYQLPVCPSHHTFFYAALGCHPCTFPAKKQPPSGVPTADPRVKNHCTEELFAYFYKMQQANIHSILLNERAIYHRMQWKRVWLSMQDWSNLLSSSALDLLVLTRIFIILGQSRSTWIAHFSLDTPSFSSQKVNLQPVLKSTTTTSSCSHGSAARLWGI